MNALEDKPYIVSWNLTKQCNLSCPHCYIDAHPNLNSAHENELTRDDAQSVINALSSLNNNLMLILSGGEPMLREDIFDIVRSASSAGLIVVLGSNGILLTRDSLRMLKEAGLMGVGISIDSTGHAHHDSFRGYKGAWDLSVSALRYSKEAGLETQVDVTLTDQNCSEVDDFVELGVSMGAKAVNFFFLVCTGRAMRTDISTENYDVVLKKIAKISMNERRLMIRARCAPHFYRILYEEGFPVQKGMRGCLAGRHYLRIDPEGNITPCPYMPLTIGNIKEKPLSAIWEESEQLILLRNGSYNGRCGMCEYTEICGGCRARALAVKEDIMGEDPLCNYTPQSGRQVVFSETLHGQCEWTPEAKERIKKVPFFMQGIVTKIIEAKARERGAAIITEGIIDELKELRNAGK